MISRTFDGRGRNAKRSGSGRSAGAGPLIHGGGEGGRVRSAVVGPVVSRSGVKIVQLNRQICLVGGGGRSANFGNVVRGAGIRIGDMLVMNAAVGINVMVVVM